MAFFREAVATDIDRWIEIVERLGGLMSEAWKARVRNSDIMALRAAAASDRQDISKSLVDFTRPCLFYAGSDDPLRDSVTRCESFFPDARFFMVPNCNHVTALLRTDLEGHFLLRSNGAASLSGSEMTIFNFVGRVFGSMVPRWRPPMLTG